MFEVFLRHLPGRRRFGVVAGTGRLVDLVRRFRFGDDELRWLRDENVVDADTVRFLEGFRFRGDIVGYAEGEPFFPGSPVLTVAGTFAEAVVLETIALSVLNHDSAVATAAARMSAAAGDRPLAEMGSRRAGEESAVAAARAAYIAGFAATSNLEAGRRWGVPTMGTAAHAWTLLHDTEADAFRAQIDALGTGTTLLVDTYDTLTGIETAVAVAGPALGGVRIDSGDPVAVAGAVRRRLDDLGATATRITVTGDLDEFRLAELAASPVDAYGVGTSVVTGSGQPTAGLVYKLVAHEDAAGAWRSVAKTSAQKASHGGRKRAFRETVGGVATAELLVVDDADPGSADPGTARRPLQVAFMTAGEADPAREGAAAVAAARTHHTAARAELPAAALELTAAEPALPTRYRPS